MPIKIVLFVAIFARVQSQTICTTSRCTVSDNQIRFSVLGDFGGWPIPPFYSPAQSRVADIVGNYSKYQNTHFYMELGDNFYENGVRNLRDRRFQNTFEKVYTDDGKPWYMIAGNHDHYGNVSAQIDYSRVSDRWVFPELYYTVQYQTTDGTTLDIIMIDTVTLCGNTKDLENVEDPLLVSHTEEHAPRGPKNVLESEAQWTWIEQQLANSNADYIFVMGHFPVWSAAEHGPTTCLLQRLEPLLHQYDVDVYVNGHDHSLQHFIVEDNSTTVNYLVNGAAAVTVVSFENFNQNPPGSLQFQYPTDGYPWTGLGFTQGGFTYFTVDTNGVTFQFVRGDGDIMYGPISLPKKNRN